MNVYLPLTARLPSTYQEVEYIQSTGTQYINTGYIPSNNTKIEMSMGGFNSSTSSNSLFGARYSWNVDASIGRGFQWAVNTSTSPYGYGGMFGRRYSTGDDNFNVFNWGDGGNHILSLDQSGFYQDGVKKYTPNTVTFTSPVNLVIFSNNNNGQISEFAPYKLYYFKIRDNGTLVRNFIPCYRKSDNVIGLYDLVNSAFYTNAGSGTFSKGNDVTMTELKNAYIGEYPTMFEYDFTQSDAGWTLDSGVLRDSNGFYVNGTLVDKKITAPSEIFDGIPNKIKLEFYRPNGQVGTGFMNLSVSPTLMIECPRNNTSYIQYVGFYDGTWYNVNVGTVPTGNMTWEVDIDSSTSNWNNVHKITGLSNISESNGVLKKIWESGIFQIRIVNWDNTGLRIKKITFYY